MLRVVEVRFDHFFDRARSVAKIAILCEINRAHAAAANATNDLVAAVQDFTGGERFGLRSFSRRFIASGSQR